MKTVDVFNEIKEIALTNCSKTSLTPNMMMLDAWRAIFEFSIYNPGSRKTVIVGGEKKMNITFNIFYFEINLNDEAEVSGIKKVLTGELPITCFKSSKCSTQISSR